MVFDLASGYSDQAIDETKSLRCQLGYAFVTIPDSRRTKPSIRTNGEHKSQANQGRKFAA
jgi:hypothetical protein